MIPNQMFMVRGNKNYAPEENSISLTFDDGPDVDYTPGILDQLRIHDISATFFVIGEKAQSHPELIRRIVAEGHELGNHTFTHSEPAQTSAELFKQE